MNTKLKLIITLFTLCSIKLVAQNDGTNSTSNSAATSSKSMDGGVNLFSGLPNISIPIYQYKSNNGIGTSISIDYSGGGIGINEGATSVGLGWNLQVGGSIVRTVRGAPDDYPAIGYINTPALPYDYRDIADNLYNYNTDPEQDIFQFSVPGASGRFFIGKNKEIVIIPMSKTRIYPTYASNGVIEAFKIINEDGVKYYFDASLTETTSITTYHDESIRGNSGRSYIVKWNLSDIISPFLTDTIHFNYSGKNITFGGQVAQTAFVLDATGQRKLNGNSVPNTGFGTVKRIESINLPDKSTVRFVYSNYYKYDDTNRAVSQIRIEDTVLRYAFMLEYKDTVQVWKRKNSTNPTGGLYLTIEQTRLLLKKITPFTLKEKQLGYQFNYYVPNLPRIGDPFPSYTGGNDGSSEAVANSHDYWGFYNGFENNDTMRIPKVNGYNWGVVRTPNAYGAANMLQSITYPTGGNVSYLYEANTHLPIIKQTQIRNFNLNTSSLTPINLNQVYNQKHLVNIEIDRSILRDGNLSITGSGVLQLSIKNNTGSITYATTNITIAELYQYGLKTWAFTIPNGAYTLHATLINTTVNASVPYSINWENRTEDANNQSEITGGFRVFQVSKSFEKSSEPSIEDRGEGSFEQYRYITETGKSSGFIGDVPKYHHPYTQFVKYGNGPTTASNYTKLSSDPVSTMNYAQGSPVGYSRVEVLKLNRYNAGLGKEVVEFTNFEDLHTNNYTLSFPYTPIDYRNWGIGIPKKISLYDTSNNVVKRSVTQFAFDSVSYIYNDNFKSYKLGNNQTLYLGDPTNYQTPRYKKYVGEPTYIENGRIYATQTYDTIYQPNGSMNTSYQKFTYDNNYNISTITTSYDKTKGLEKVERRYYPYNYTTGGAVGKLRDSGLLNNIISSESWIVGDGNPRLIAGGITTYKQLANGIIKPDTVFTTVSNKPIPFNPDLVLANTNVVKDYNLYKPQSLFTLYDTKGELIETKDLITGISNTVLNGYDNNYTIAKVTNATNADVAYTSFETGTNGNWVIGNAVRDNTTAITGKKSYNLSNGSITKAGLSTANTYLVTLWAKAGATVQVNGTTLNTIIANQQGYNLYNAILTNQTTATISGTGIIDELRLHPTNANMETTTYEPHIGITSVTDANNTMLYTEYDGLNRVKLIRSKDKNILKRMDYSDTTMNSFLIPTWVFQGISCLLNQPEKDSVFLDTNQYSETYNTEKRIFTGVLDCYCSGTMVANPQYKIVGGLCEKGVLVVVAAVAKQILVNGTYVWGWECTKKYCFSDYTVSDWSKIQNSVTYCDVSPDCGVNEVPL